MTTYYYERRPWHVWRICLLWLGYLTLNVMMSLTGSPVMGDVFLAVALVSVFNYHPERRRALVILGTDK